jgi:DNA/RNA endonuclease YhcR with UshA esterase domain
MRSAICSFLLFACLAPFSLAEQKVSPAEAKQHIGEHATVCGAVASVRFAQRSKGQPTFLNLDKPYPNQIFTIVIWGENRTKFGTPEEKYRGKQVCVSGNVREYRGTPEMIASDPGQIQE